MLVTGALLGAGTESSLVGLFPQSAARDWPHGVQETDVPRFAVEHLDSLRPARSANVEPSRLPPHIPHISRQAI